MKAHSKQYTDYLHSEAWNERRQARLQKAKYRCERCGERDKLDVHHKTYEHFGNEPLSDLIALCQSCHWAADEERRGNDKPKNKFKEKSKKSKYDILTEKYERRREQKRAKQQKRLEEKYNHPIDMKVIE